MTKIAEFEQKLITGGMTEDDLSEFSRLLRRVPDGFLKRQHCYTTAIQFPCERAEQAVRLITYGLENVDDGWFSTYESYQYIGLVYQRAGRYLEAYQNFLLAKDVLSDAHSENYLPFLSQYLMWMRLHIDSFQYSAELEDLYTCFASSDEFSLAFRESAFKLAVAEIVIALHYGDHGKARESLTKAKAIAEPTYEGPLHDLLARHRYRESLAATPEVLRYLEAAENSRLSDNLSTSERVVKQSLSQLR